MQLARSKHTLKDRLAQYRQIKLSVIGRKSGRSRSRRFVVSPSRRAAVWGLRSLPF